MTTQDAGASAPESAAPTFPAEAPEKASPMTKSLWPEAAKAFETMTAAVEAVAKVKGSATEFQARAKADVYDTEDGKYVSDLVESFVTMAAAGQAWLEEQYGSRTAELMKDLTPKKDAAEKKYSEARADFDAALQFLGKDKAVAKVIATVTMPTLPKSTRGTGGGSAVKITGLRYWRQLAGQAKEYQGPTQNKASTLAYHYGGSIIGQDKGNMGALVQYGMSKGVNVKGTEPWSLDLPDGTKIGADKVDSPDETPDATKDSE